MGRSLPWAKAQAQSAPTKRPQARAQVLHPAQQAAVPLSRDVATDSSRPRKQRRLGREDRTPSTSPPPAPPPEEFMREGFDHDDIYMMVEDEFYSVAQSFTQHLHHQEYVRLKNIAKAKGVSSTSSNLRPTDSVTEMREELKKKKQAEVQAEKHKQALLKLGAGAGSKRIKLSDGEDDSEEDDLWAGTTLKGLMASPSKNKTSLLGLQGNKSSTRAAAGYSPPKLPDSKNTVTFDMTASSKNGSRMKGRDGSSQATASDDDDDLDAPLQKLQEPPAFKSIERDVSSKIAPRARAAIAKSHNINRPSQQATSDTRGGKHKITSPSSDSDSEESPALPAMSLSRVSRPLKRFAYAKNGIKDVEAKAKSQTNVNEIPIFLV